MPTVETRRNRVQTVAALVLLNALGAQGQITGERVSQFVSLDDAIQAAMVRYQVPGGSVAIAKDGRLVYARGFGRADIATGEPVRPDSMFRSASVSKPFTAAAALRLVQEHRLDLDEPILPRLQKALGDGFRIGDARIAAITVRDLLRHSGGWDRDSSFDPMFQSATISNATREPAPASCETVMRYMFQRRLDFTPGTMAAYSNFGYCVLARVIEAAGGEPYEQYIVREILRPLGVTRMRQGRTLEAQRLPDEVRYYDYRGMTASVFPTGPRQVPWPYGGYYLESMDASGAWLASSIDLVRFGESTRAGSVRLMSPEMVDMTLRDPGLSFRNLASGYHYGLGWFVTATRSGERLWGHGGSMPGVVSQLSVNTGNVTWAWMFNATLRDEEAFRDSINGAIIASTQSVIGWPDHDFFGVYQATVDDGPELDDNGLMNAASLQTDVSPGAWVTLKGRRLAAASRSWRTDDFRGAYLPTSIDGVRVIANGRFAPIAFVSENQINALLPLSTPDESDVWVQVIREGIASRPRKVRLALRAPAILAYKGGGSDFAAAVHADGTLVGDPLLTESSRAARPGDRISLYATGLMPFAVERSLERPEPLDRAVSVFVGEAEARVEFSALTAPGLQQVNIVVPSMAPGNHALRVVVWDFESRQMVSLPVR
ncbi:MAG: serine hydrolase [Bryobacteraceae bacterium]